MDSEKNRDENKEFVEFDDPEVEQRLFKKAVELEEAVRLQNYKFDALEKPMVDVTDRVVREFVVAHSDFFSKSRDITGVTVKRAYAWFSEIDPGRLISFDKFREALKPYFSEFHESIVMNGVNVYGFYTGFKGVTHPIPDAMKQDGKENVMEFVSKYFEMDPETDDLLFDGTLLEVGMRVLIEADSKRAPIHEGKPFNDHDRARKYNRWVTVSEFRRYGLEIAFIGIFDDGTKKKFAEDFMYAWYVKKDSMTSVEEDESETSARWNLIQEEILVGAHNTLRMNFEPTDDAHDAHDTRLHEIAKEISEKAVATIGYVNGIENYSERMRRLEGQETTAIVENPTVRDYCVKDVEATADAFEKLSSAMNDACKFGEVLERRIAGTTLSELCREFHPQNEREDQRLDTLAQKISSKALNEYGELTNNMPIIELATDKHMKLEALEDEPDV